VVSTRREFLLIEISSDVDARQSRMPSQIIASVAQLTSGLSILGQKGPAADSNPALSR
jgi:hypothetical protein